jgi:hypothetical protein
MTWNGRYVVIYGGGGNGNAPSATVYGYDPVANAWSVLVDANATPSPGALESATIASSGSGNAENPDAGSGVGAPILLFGGSTTFMTMNATWSMVPGSGWTLEIFEGANGSPPARSGNLLFWDGGEYLTFGGGGPNQVNFTDVWTYAPATKKWTQISANNANGAPATANKFYKGAWAGTQLLVVLSDSSVWSFTP